MYSINARHCEPIFLRTSGTSRDLLTWWELQEQVANDSVAIHKHGLDPFELPTWNYWVILADDFKDINYGTPIHVRLVHSEMTEHKTATCTVAMVDGGPVITVHGEPLSFTYWPEGADASSAVKTLEELYENGGNLRVVWGALIDAVGRAEATTLVTEKLGQEKFRKIFNTIHGE